MAEGRGSHGLFFLLLQHNQLRCGKQSPGFPEVGMGTASSPRGCHVRVIQLPPGIELLTPASHPCSS